MKENPAVGRRVIILDAMKYARREAYKNPYIPKALRNKIEIVIKEDGNIVIKKKDNGRSNIG